MSFRMGFQRKLPDEPDELRMSFRMSFWMSLDELPG
jgi:hypothetical protein